MQTFIICSAILVQNNEYRILLSNYYIIIANKDNWDSTKGGLKIYGICGVYGLYVIIGVK